MRKRNNRALTVRLTRLIPSPDRKRKAAPPRDHYFDIVEARAAKEYWNIRPAKKGNNVVPMIAG